MVPVVSRSFRTVGIIQPIGLIGWINNVIVVQNIQYEKKQDQKWYAPAFKEIRKGPRDSQQDRKKEKYWLRLVTGIWVHP